MQDHGDTSAGVRCPNCGCGIADRAAARQLGMRGGTVTSRAKRDAARRNGCLGGRPRKQRAEARVDANERSTAGKEDA